MVTVHLATMIDHCTVHTQLALPLKEIEAAKAAHGTKQGDAAAAAAQSKSRWEEADTLSQAHAAAVTVLEHTTANNINGSIGVLNTQTSLALASYTALEVRSVLLS